MWLPCRPNSRRRQGSIRHTVTGHRGTSTHATKPQSVYHRVGQHAVAMQTKLQTETSCNVKGQQPDSTSCYGAQRQFNTCMQTQTPDGDQARHFVMWLRGNSTYATWAPERVSPGWAACGCHQTELQTETRLDSTSRNGAQTHFDICDWAPERVLRGWAACACQADRSLDGHQLQCQRATARSDIT